MRKPGLLGVVVVSVALLLGACGDDDEIAETDDAADTATGATEEGDASEGGGDETGDGAATVRVVDSDLGEILVDGEGMTLYLFTQDTAGKSNCSGGCATTWPPLAADGDLQAGDGVEESGLTTIDRDDGTKQVAYKGVPLYYYAPDEAPGDTKGQGVGGVWYVLGPDGRAIEATEDAGSPSY